jgi:Fe-Mn family superoxide dismutase
MTHSLPNLPYSLSALEPHISANTLSFHHGKHHQTYVTNLNNLLQNSPLQNLSLEEVILASADKSELVGIFNNAAQVWNHTFFWNSMKPQGGGIPTGKISDLISSAFGSYEKFASEFKQTALSQFGSGWTWLVLDGEALKIIKTANADLPMVKGMKALLTCDVWEHAYYLDYQNRRADYVDIFLNHLVNWEFSEANLQA